MKTTIEEKVKEANELIDNISAKTINLNITTSETQFSDAIKYLTPTPQRIKKVCILSSGQSSYLECVCKFATSKNRNSRLITVNCIVHKLKQDLRKQKMLKLSSNINSVVDEVSNLLEVLKQRIDDVDYRIRYIVHSFVFEHYKHVIVTRVFKPEDLIRCLYDKNRRHVNKLFKDFTPNPDVYEDFFVNISSISAEARCCIVNNYILSYDRQLGVARNFGVNLKKFAQFGSIELVNKMFREYICENCTSLSDALVSIGAFYGNIISKIAFSDSECIEIFKCAMEDVHLKRYNLFRLALLIRRNYVSDEIFGLFHEIKEVQECINPYLEYLLAVDASCLLGRSQFIKELLVLSGMLSSEKTTIVLLFRLLKQTGSSYMCEITEFFENSFKGMTIQVLEQFVMNWDFGLCPRDDHPNSIKFYCCLWKITSRDFYISEEIAFSEIECFEDCKQVASYIRFILDELSIAAVVRPQSPVDAELSLQLLYSKLRCIFLKYLSRPLLSETLLDSSVFYVLLKVAETVDERCLIFEFPEKTIVKMLKKCDNCMLEAFLTWSLDLVRVKSAGSFKKACSLAKYLPKIAYKEIEWFQTIEKFSAHEALKVCIAPLLVLVSTEGCKKLAGFFHLKPLVEIELDRRGMLSDICASGKSSVDIIEI